MGNSFLVGAIRAGRNDVQIKEAIWPLQVCCAFSRAIHPRHNLHIPLQCDWKVLQNKILRSSFMIIFICCEESNDGDQRKFKQLYIHKLKAVDHFQDTQQEDTTREMDSPEQQNLNGAPAVQIFKY